MSNREFIDKHNLSANIVLGKDENGGYLELKDKRSACIYAPTASGSSVSVYTPNLLNFADSVVVLDNGQEYWNLSSGFRSKFSECILFAPMSKDVRSACWNPLDYISRDTSDWGFGGRLGINFIAHCLYPETKQDAFFASRARNLFAGLVMLLLESPGRPVSIPEMLRVFKPISGLSFHVWFFEELERRKGNSIDSDEPPFSPECVFMLMVYCTADDKLRENVKSTLLAPLSVFSDPMVAACTSSSTFRLDEVRKKKMSIYVCLNQKQAEPLRGLLTLFFSQLLAINTFETEETKHKCKNQCLIIIDDHTKLNKLKDFYSFITSSDFNIENLAPFNMRLMLGTQNLVTLRDSYGQPVISKLLFNTAWVSLGANPTPYPTIEINQSDSLIFVDNQKKQKLVERVFAFNDPVFSLRQNLKREISFSS